MLNHLKIQNFALIESVELDLSKGFSVVTGETGAGKSIVLNALQLVLGARADVAQIQNSGKKCVIEAQFSLSEDKKDLFGSLDIDFWVETILRREINAHGKSRMFINDSPVNLNTLKTIGEEILEIHTQHQTYEIKSKEFALNLIDDMGGLTLQRKSYAKEFKLYKKFQLEFETKKKNLEENSKEIDYLKFQLSELEEIDFENDFAEFQTKFDQAENTEKIVSNLTQINYLLGESESNVLSAVKSSGQLLEEIKAFTPQGEELSGRLQSVMIELDDISSEISSLSESVGINPEEKHILEEKLSKYNSLLNKHFLTTQSELQNLKTDIESKLSEIEVNDDVLEELKSTMDKQLTLCQTLAQDLRAKRELIATSISSEIESELKDLSMTESRISFDFQDKPISINGIDTVQCLISVNKGHPLSPIEKSISGGEMSRYMLSVKNLLSTKKSLPTLIFDEIDTGVSGVIAEQMASKMKFMSSNIQVLAITHLPQVASMGDEHFMVKKTSSDNETTTSIVKLNKDERVNEVAKLISGSEITNEAISHAKGMLSQ